MPTFVKFDCFTQDLGSEIHNLHAPDTLKMMLTNTAPSPSNSVKTDITEISAVNGYTAGGATLAGVSYGQVAGLSTLHANSFSITASGGSFGPARYAVLYNDSAPSDNLIGYADYGTSTTVNSGESWDVNIDATLGIIQVG